MGIYAPVHHLIQIKILLPAPICGFLGCFNHIFFWRFWELCVCFGSCNLAPTILSSIHSNNKFEDRLFLCCFGAALHFIHKSRVALFDKRGKIPAMSNQSKMSKGQDKGKDKSYKICGFKDPFPICPVGKDYCKMPRCPYQIFTSFCDNCGKECHEGCGELLDVPHKFLGDEPGFYCLKCIDILPRSLYPRIPCDGIPRNGPNHCDDGSVGFEEYMLKRKRMVAKEKAKKKKDRSSGLYHTRASVARFLRSRR